MVILGRVEEIDQQMDRINMLIERASRDDPELGAGLAAGSLVGAQKLIDTAAVAAEELDAHLRRLASTARV